MSADPVGGSRRRPLRVLEVAAEFLPNLGGVETHTLEVSRRIARRGDIELTVLATDRPGSLPRAEDGDGFRVLRRRAYPRGRDWYLAPGVASVIRNGDWDLVHFQGVHTLVPIVGMAAARSAGVPYVLTFHSGGHSSGLRRAVRGTQWRAITPLLRDARRLIAVSRSERTLFADATGLGPEHFIVIRNGGSLPPARGPVEIVPDRVLTVGRLVEYKGHQRAIAVLAELLPGRPDARLVVLGNGPYEAELRALADRLGIAGHVDFRSVAPGDRAGMSREYGAAALVLALSDYEAHPVAVMEALALGVPVVGSDTAGIGDLVQDGVVTGVLPDASAADVATVVDRVLAGAATGSARAAPAGLPTWDACAEELAAVYLAAADRD